MRIALQIKQIIQRAVNESLSNQYNEDANGVDD